ncbi:MAG: M20/M25/M40 family metallo-hydrolase [Actinomycetota bacterium]
MLRVPAVVATALVVFVGCTGNGSSLPGIESPASDPRTPDTAAEARRAVTVERIREHLEALAAIATENGGNRAAGTAGYDGSVEYVARRLEEAGYDVTLQRFSAPVFEQLRPSVLEVHGGRRFVDGKDFKAMIYSAAGDVTAPLATASFDPDGTGREGLGCDGLSLPPGSVALLRPGPCFFRDQVVNAVKTGARAVIFAVPEYSRHGGVLRPTLITPDGIDVPVVAATDAAGRALYAAGEGAEIHVATEVSSGREEVANVIADSNGGDGDIVMMGGHLDSVIDGPGINDNGSGVATILEVAEEFAGAAFERPTRFAFWAGEELGLLGSRHYISTLDDEVDDIAVYLNFDMLASSNHVHYVYADQGPEAGEAITAAFEAALDRAGEPHETIDLEGRSDHGPFLQARVPVGGLFSGADDRKTERQERLFGGTAGAQADPCYHRACDDLDNVDETSLEVMGGRDSRRRLPAGIGLNPDRPEACRAAR